MKCLKHLNEERKNSVNKNTHNFKMGHDTAFKLGKHKVESLICCLSKNEIFWCSGRVIHLMGD